MDFSTPLLESIIADLRFCSSLESLTIAREQICDDIRSEDLPDLILHELSSLKIVQLRGWCPRNRFTIPSRCVVRLFMAAETPDEWLQWQRRGCPTSMLCLTYMGLQTWHAGIGQVSGLQYLDLHMQSMQEQDLGAFDQIPHVRLTVKRYSTFLLTRGSWRSLHIVASDEIYIKFSDTKAFVRGTERFLLDQEGNSEKARSLFCLLGRTCRRQGVACQKCEHTHKRFGKPDLERASLSSVELRKIPEYFAVANIFERYRG